MSACSTARVLTRPAYNNAAVHSFPQWCEDNRKTLIAWWWRLDLALRADGGPAAAQADDFDLFCRCQHDREARGVTP